MTDGEFQLATTSEVLCALPVPEAITKSAKLECWDYGQVFWSEAKEAEQNGDDETATAWRLLAQLSQMMLEESNPSEPFRPLVETSDGRSVLPSDIDQATAEAIRDLAENVDDPEMKARLSDIAWNRLRDPRSSREAVHSYLASAEQLFDPDSWPPYAKRIERALRLAAQLNDNDLVDTVLSEMERRVIELDGSDPLYMTSTLMELLAEFRKGDPESMSAIATKAAKAAEADRDFERARSHWENLVRWRRLAKDREGERNARIQLAETYEKQSDLHRGEGGEMLVAHWLEKAHEAYRNISGMREKTAEIYDKLREAQQQAVGSMQEIRTDGIDITESIAAARRHVSGVGMREALLRLAHVDQPTDFSRAEAQAKELMNQFPLQSIMGAQLMARDGRVVAERAVALGGDEAQAKQALWQRVVEQTEMTYDFTAQAAISPAINQVRFEHCITLRDLHPLVVNNPLIPQGHEELFARAFLAGLRGDFEDALPTLVPQIENSLRALLARDGKETTRRNSQGIQTVIQMGTILSEYDDVLGPMLGDDTLKELKVLFNDQHGPNLRNHIAHGMMAHGHFFSGSAIYAWWFIFHLCMRPVVARFQPPSDEKGDETAQPNEPIG